MFQQAMELSNLLSEEQERVVDCNKLKKEVVADILNLLEREEMSEWEQKRILLLVLELIQENDEVFLNFFGNNVACPSDFENYSTV
ncbi:MAG: hypothetical protein R6V40_04250 [Candidatus Moraniibacteriota bacterium]